VVSATVEPEAESTLARVGKTVNTLLVAVCWSGQQTGYRAGGRHTEGDLVVCLSLRRRAPGVPGGGRPGGL